MSTDVDLLMGLLKMNEKYRVLFQMPPNIKTAMGKYTCSVCNSTRYVLPNTTLNVCHNCGVNKFNLQDFKTNVISSILGKCQLCGQNYKVGWKIYSAPMCSSCVSKIKPT